MLKIRDLGVSFCFLHNNFSCSLDCCRVDESVASDAAAVVHRRGAGEDVLKLFASSVGDSTKKFPPGNRLDQIPCKIC